MPQTNLQRMDIKSRLRVVAMGTQATLQHIQTRQVITYFIQQIKHKVQLQMKYPMFKIRIMINLHMISKAQQYINNNNNNNNKIKIKIIKNEARILIKTKISIRLFKNLH